tara:strand:- start:73 stop:246 length:174 start_codon:yes stop_codon:yes gene_type:complete
VESKKVIITKQKRIYDRYSFDNIIGLSTYDLALISSNKIINKKKLTAIESSNITFLI